MAHNDVCARARRNTERVFNEINCLNLLMIDCNSCHVGGAAFIPSSAIEPHPQPLISHV